MKLIHVEEPEHKEEAAYKKAKEILRIKPDVILFEYPAKEGYSLSDFNKFGPKEKPKQKIADWKKRYATFSKKYPWLKSEHKIIEAIEQLWSEGKHVLLFEIDGPMELTRVEGTRGLLNIVWNYLREKYMAENIRKISKIDKKVALVLCHNFHWKNIQFLLKAPNKEQIWDYYFTRSGIKKLPKEVESELERRNKTLHKYWKLKSDFS